MQEREQVVDLLVAQYHVKRRHVAAAHFDSLAYVLVICGNAAGKIVFAEDSNQRRPLQRLLFIGVVAERAIRLKDHASAVLGRRESALRARPAGFASNADEQCKDCQKE
jgi:hypothetical protein